MTPRQYICKKTSHDKMASTAVSYTHGPSLQDKMGSPLNLPVCPREPLSGPCSPLGQREWSQLSGLLLPRAFSGLRMQKVEESGAFGVLDVELG